MAVTGRTIVTDALLELGAVGANETPDASDAAFALGKLTRLIDNLNADRQAVFADQFLTFTITPSLQPHTIGPTGATWTTAQRPVSIEAAQLVITSDSSRNIDLHDAAWWNALILPTTTSSYPTDGYYDPTWPNGALYLWPVPTAAYQVQLLVRGILGAYTLDTVFTLPPGYQDAITLTLAEMCSGKAFGVELTPGLALAATKARARIFANNIVVPHLSSSPAGMPGGRPDWFDYQTGRIR